MTRVVYDKKLELFKDSIKSKLEEVLSDEERKGLVDIFSDIGSNKYKSQAMTIARNMLPDGIYNTMAENYLDTNSIYAVCIYINNSPAKDIPTLLYDNVVEKNRRGYWNHYFVITDKFERIWSEWCRAAYAGPYTRFDLFIIRR